MKKTLPLARDSAKIDLMNQISTTFGYFTPVGGFIFKEDSSQSYTLKAYNDAKRIGYKSGLAQSLLGLKTNNDSDREKNILEAMRLGEESKNSKVLGWAYYSWADLPSVKKDFKQHIENYKKSVWRACVP